MAIRGRLIALASRDLHLHQEQKVDTAMFAANFAGIRLRGEKVETIGGALDE